MKKSLLFPLIILSLAIIILSGCKKDNSTLEGTYRHSQIIYGVSYLVELQFTDNGRLIWTPVGEIPGHTASEVSYEKTGDKQYRIYGDNDCGTEAVYSFAIDSEVLITEAITEDCSPRLEAISGIWTRQ
jgi:hypothetical protein